jgi:hypothetical protein
MKRILLGVASVAVALAITTPARAGDHETCVGWNSPYVDDPSGVCVPVQVCLPCVVSPGSY